MNWRGRGVVPAPPADHAHPAAHSLKNHPKWPPRKGTFYERLLSCSPGALFWATLAASHDRYGGKGPLRPSSPAVTPAPPGLLNHVPKCHVHAVFEPLQGWGLPHCPGQPGPTPDHSCRKEIVPDIPSKPPLLHLEAIASRPVAGYLGEDPSPPHSPLLAGSCREREGLPSASSSPA